MNKVKYDPGTWVIPEGLDTSKFDFSWRPNPKDPPYIHQFGTQHQKTGGPRYVIPGATQIKYQESQHAIKISVDANWSVPASIDPGTFDFTWHPDSTEPPATYQFPDQWYSDGGPVYACQNPLYTKQMPGPTAIKLPNMECWDNCSNIKTFDFSWYPHAGEPEPYIYQFPRSADKPYTGPRYVVPGAKKIKYMVNIIPTYEIDWSRWIIPENIDKDSFDWTWEPDEFEPEPYIYQFSTKWNKIGGPKYIVPGANKVKLIDRIIACTVVDWSRWVIPDRIDRESFDWTWEPPEYEPEPYIYQFPDQWYSDGGPQYIVPGANKTKQIDTIIAKTIQNQQLWHISDNVVDFDFSWYPHHSEPPAIHCYTVDGYDATEYAPLQYKTGNSNTKKFYDGIKGKLKDLDIIFISNGEPGAEDRYKRLCDVSRREVKWVNGIQGREYAIRHAAELSNTQWFFCFPGKLYADEKFNFQFQPDRLFEPKHYIFYALNPLNGLIYGHQAAVCYNKNLVLETTDYGLDFTMSKLHDIMPFVSGVAEYNINPWMAWRTAFREVVKLKAAPADDTVSKERLDVWCSVADGKNAEWSINGAKDAVIFYDAAAGDPAELIKTFSWSWLREYYYCLYGVKPD